jgi:hypothetical protein
MTATTNNDWLAVLPTNFFARDTRRARHAANDVDWAKSDIQDTRALVMVDAPFIATYRVRDAEVEIFSICHAEFCS